MNIFCTWAVKVGGEGVTENCLEKQKFCSRLCISEVGAGKKNFFLSGGGGGPMRPAGSTSGERV